MTSDRILIVPSILSADFGHLAEQIQAAERAGADRFQIDVMDGQFVPNITMGPLAVEAARRATSLPLEVHLMVAEPERFIATFARAGADFIQVHVEATHALHRCLAAIAEAGAKAGIAISPATPVSSLEEVTDLVDQINVMTVEPGFGGQPFIASSIAKIRRLRALAADCEIEVDGGVNAASARRCVAAGAGVLVAGSAIFGYEGGIDAGIRAIRDSLS